jgi:hypothetical protein
LQGASLPPFAIVRVIAAKSASPHAIIFPGADEPPNSQNIDDCQGFAP